MKRQNEPKKVRARVIWDEANLGEIEANKPTRQKIDEPKTPYHAPEYDDGMLPSVAHNETSLDDAAHAEAVRNALSRLVASTSEWSREGGDCSSGDEAEDMEYDGEVHIANGSGMSFEELRRLHYDEFRKLQELRQQISIDHEADKVNEKESSTARESKHRRGTMEDGFYHLEVF